jgi:quercetin dioxygenase-like cupin family protein
MFNSWQNLKDSIEYPKSGIFSKELFRNEKINLTLFCLASGSEISEHTSTKKGFIHVVEGKGLFQLAGNNVSMEENVFISMEDNAIHSLRAESNLSFVLFLID